MYVIIHLKTAYSLFFSVYQMIGNLYFLDNCVTLYHKMYYINITLVFRNICNSFVLLMNLMILL